MQLEAYIIGLIEGRKKSTVVSGLLYALSGLFETGVKLRNFAFDRHLFKETKVEVPVVSIGNIIAGGTGKTALIQKLAKDLSPYGKVSVLIRGYRSEIEKGGGSLHLMENAKITPEVCGDEAYLLSKLLPGLSLFVGKNRVLNAKRAAYHQADVILLDDGMQYRKLGRDFEIVMLHADDLFGKGFYLPRGYLRDSPKRLKEANYVLINHIEDAAHFEAVKQKVRQMTPAPLIGVQMVPLSIKGKDGEQCESLEGKRVAVFCGLGKPGSFMKTLEKMGANLAETRIFPDHIAPTKQELIDFSLLAEERGCEMILCSEKDWVKLPKEWGVSLPVFYVEAYLEISAGREAYDEMLRSISLKMRRAHEALD